jgi:hypothetical protein
MINVLKSQLDSSLKSVRRFLERPICVQQGNLTLGVPASSQRAQAREAQRQRVRRMRRDLYQLMEQHPSSRQLMRHLDLVERTLRDGGLGAIEALPVRVIANALAQMERLVWDWTPVGLAELRSRLAVIVKNRPAQAAKEEAEREAASTRSLELEMSMHQTADVTEVEADDLAVFEEMERSWAGRMPEAVAQAMSAAKEPSAA